MRVLSGHPALLGIGDALDGDPGQLLATVIHVPLLAEIGDHDARVAELTGVHDNSLLLLLPDSLINGDDAPQVVDITEHQDIVFQASLLGYLGVDLIHVDLVVEPMAHLDQVVGSGFAPNCVLRVV